MDKETRKKLVDQYKAGYKAVADALSKATDKQLDARPAPGKWTAREIVHHLADSEMTSAIRLRLLIATDRPQILGYDQDEFAIVPEFGIKLGIDLTDHLRLYAGYNLLCLSNVLRAGEQIDRVINPNLLPDLVTPPGLNPMVVQPARPTVPFRDSSFWAGGASFGLEYHW